LGTCCCRNLGSYHSCYHACQWW
jgi:hypothetical protein